MKRRSTKLYLALVAVMSILASCSKTDDNYNYKNMPTSIELPIAAHAGPAMFDNGGFKFNIAKSISSAPQPLVTTVLLSATKPLSKDVTVTLSVDNGSISALNATHKALYTADSLAAVKADTDVPDATDFKYEIYQPLPADAYSVPSTKVTIPAGQTTADHIVNIITDKLTLGVKYMLPVAIADAQGEKINYYSTVYYIVGIKSEYEGEAKASGSIAFPDPSINRSWTDRAKTLTTVNGNIIRAEAADLGGSNYYMWLIVNPDNSVTVISAPGAANPSIQTNGSCTFDPATRTFNLNYKYVGGTGDRRITEVIKLN
ncbi:DUF1735 domain-containing protein [Mucilaginibacter sp. ZT4R22]|uniref:DUF1735 domain-containing protein n=1 Tax=Mucilaginibacter pankratovii TaxID=2772110 RepID=A0ABR7WLG0_9SPHI|nr:DUF1735 domain-containing protein [Mucilaginibacter pankratovii]MBD1363163.1 DUF1735 domain-containing protein [Mucilaginibacter pankratovii]